MLKGVQIASCLAFLCSTLDCFLHVMYIYIMNRTQIYLTDEEEKALSRRARKTGRSKSDLIREAIDSNYLTAAADATAFIEVLEKTAGAWTGRSETGAQYVNKLRSGRLGRLHDRTK